MKRNITISISPGALFAVFIVLLILKLAGLVAISWFWVTFPILLPIYFVLAVLMIVTIIIVSYFVGAGLLEIFGATRIDWSWLARWKRKLLARFSR